MNDKELADKVVGIGVGSRQVAMHPYDYRVGIDCVNARAFVRDWRIVGALMERCLEVDQVMVGREDGQFFCDLPTKFPFDTYCDDSLPRAIIEACVRALS